LLVIENLTPTPFCYIREYTMTESEFTQLIDEIIMQIEDALDELDNDIDYETSAGILTITLENNSQIIINRQISAMQYV